MAKPLLIAGLARGCLASAAVSLACLLAAPAWAQFNPFEALFGSPPRPPGSVPGSRQPAGPPPQQQAYPQYPDQRYDPRYQDPRYQDPVYQDPRYQRAPAPGAGPGGVQSQPLPPPAGGVTTATVPPASQPLGMPRRGGADAAPPPEEVAEPPAQKIVNKSALFSGLDKITGRIINFDAAVGETVQFGALQVTTRACYTRPATETANTDAFIEVDEVTLQGEVKRIFTGWIFASSPGLHAVEHPIYDVWLTDCKSPVVAAAPVEVAPPPPPAKPTPAARRPAGQPAAANAAAPRR
ncbi:MAG: DUF2155 domain-containing protein [Hyphomicrobiales bacterium]|nr:DUF2155 domain-containing protein [Hyphomicrobiales bacterium]